jgi:uncharacterized membrane protein YkgB
VSDTQPGDPQPSDPQRSDPHRRDRTRPAELLGLSAVLAIFVGAFVLLGTRKIELALIFAGVAFIVALVVLAMLMLAVGPDRLPDVDAGNEEPDAEGKTPRSPH